MPYLGNQAGNRFVASKAATQFSGDGSTTAFTLDHAVGSDEDILVSVDGVIQEPSVAYAVSNGTTLTFTGAPSNNSGNNIFVYYLFRTVGTVSHPNNGALSASTGTFTGNVTVTGDVTVNTGGTDTLKVDAALDKVGVNTTTPSNYYSDDFVVTAGDEGGMTIVNSTTHRGYLAFADGTSGDARYRGYISYDHNTDFLYLGAGGSGYLHIDGSGRVVAPNQPHFQARSNAGNNGNTWETGQVIKFQTVAVNQGSHYSTSTGRFTAPVSGFYQFNFVGFGYNGGSVGTQTVSVNLLINGSGYIMIAYENNSNGAGNTYPAVSASSAVYLSANDHASIYVQGSGIYADSSNLYTAFSGFLVA